MLKKELEKYYNEDRYKADLDLILEEANRCKNIVSNLLNFARQGKLNLKEFDVKKVLYDVLKPFTVNPAYKKIDFIFNAGNNDCLIVADEDQLKQVFINIIKNACDAMMDTEKKILTVNLNCNEREVLIEFSDTGTGIPKENQNKIFTPFFTTKSIGKGTGLGLAISYGIIKMHKGNISFISEEGKGTTFRLTLPRNQISNN